MPETRDRVTLKNKIVAAILSYPPDTMSKAEFMADQIIDALPQTEASGVEAAYAKADLPGQIETALTNYKYGQTGLKDTKERLEALLLPTEPSGVGELREELEKIAANQYGLQGIIEDYGDDTNAYNYHASKYWASEVDRLKKIARQALTLPVDSGWRLIGEYKYHRDGLVITGEQLGTIAGEDVGPWMYKVQQNYPGIGWNGTPTHFKALPPAPDSDGGGA